ncbi:MAG TPA: CDP-alcohol phosphatidyltransferase family protein [Bacteroidota bacterium]|nr:CDP-alcohol phosphatidyltransferase family protein [Bacteroidota bacterium]
MSKASDSILRIPIVVAHEKLGLSPNQISVFGFLLGLAAAGLTAAGLLHWGMIALGLSQIVDGVDGGVARRYNLQSKKGRLLEVVFDRLSELAILLALAFAGYATLMMAGLAFLSILLSTAVQPYSHFDPGFKRFIIYFGYAATILFHVPGFQIALGVIFLANLTAFAAGTVIADYRLQTEIDRQAMIRRENERAMGVPPQPDDPPSFLSKLFS